MARLNSGTRIYGSANVDGMLVVGQITPNNANVGLANTGSLQVWGGAYISGNTTIGGQSTTEQVYVQGNSNLLTYSQNLENAAWGKVSSIVRFGPSANTYAPDGTNTASQLINNTGGVDTGYVGQDITTLNRNTPYTFSAFLKQGTATFGQINLYAANGGLNDAQANVNFNTGTAVFTGANIVNSTFVPVGGGWYRVSITLNTLNQQKLITRMYSGGAAGIVNQFSYFWGVQLEPGITPSAYANTSSGNIVKANNNLFVMGNTFIYGANTSISNTTGSLVVHGGLGVSGNVNVSNTLSVRTESGGNIPFVMQPGVVGISGARFGVAGEILDFYTTGSPFNFATNGPRSATQFVISHTSSAVNYLQVTGNTTGGGVVLSGQGSDTNVGININPKGAGSANITSTTSSTSNTSGALVITGGMGITGNLFMSAANNYSLTTTDQNSYRLGWTDNYFTRSPTFGGMYFTGTFLAVRTGAFYVDTASSLIARGVISNDVGNNTVLFAGSAPVRLQNGASSISTTTGSLIVQGGAGISGNVHTGMHYIAGSGNGIVFVDSTVQTTAGSSVANTVYLQGVNNSQNVRIDFSNTRMTIIDGVDAGQNTRMTVIEGTNASQNVRIDYSNTALTIAQGVDNSQNVRIDYSNTAITIIQGTNTTQNTNIAATDGKMSSAYNTANNAVANIGPVITTNSVAIVIIANTTASTSNATGALRVSGGVGILGNVTIGTTSINSNRTITNYGITTNALGAGSGSRTIDLTLGNFVTANATGITTWTFSNPVTSPNACGFILKLGNGGSATQTWPTAVRWPGGTAPTLTASGTDILVFITDDDGANWRGVASMLDSK